MLKRSKLMRGQPYHANQIELFNCAITNLDKNLHFEELGFWGFGVLGFWGLEL